MSVADIPLLRRRLSSRFPQGHDVYRCLDEGDFDGAADYIKGKYNYVHPLEAKVRALKPSPQAEPPAEPEPEVEEAETVSDTIVEPDEGVIVETEEEPAEGVLEEPEPPEEPERSKPKRRRSNR